MDRNKLQQIIDSAPDFEIREILDKGWEMFKAKPLFHIGFLVIIVGFQAIFNAAFEEFLFIYTIFLAPPFVVGFYLIANRISLGDFFDFKDYFGGFKFWLPVVVTNLLTSLLTVIGIILLLIPGIYLGVSYMFSLLFVIFGGFDFWESMEFSRKLVTANWWRFFAFILVLFLLNVAGLIFFIVGVFVTLPVTYLSVYALFEQLTESAATGSSEGETPSIHS